MRNTLILLFILLVFRLNAQPPQGYYDAAQGLYLEQLRVALHNIITNGHSTLSYNDLISYYTTTDSKQNGKVWDMYSDIPGGTAPYEFNFSDNCGSYGAEGDCYNREHSVPASWFNDNYPMYADLFHVVPTDGYVNNRRSNYPFGDVGSASWTSQNGSKLGSNNFPGYTGTVFEPVDSFKGDFARIYFYMATRYKDEISGWSSEMFSGNNLTAYGKNLMYSWHLLDPVSAKEIARNNSVYAIQHNRNPYVDNPQWVTEIWGPTAGTGKSYINVVEVYPIPSSSRVFFSGVAFKTHCRVLILDLSGKTVMDLTSEDISAGVDISNINSGVYLIRIITKGEAYSSKLIKN